MIHMQTNSIDLNKINFLVGDCELLCRVSDIQTLTMFSDKVVDFLAALSSKLLKESSNKSLVDVYSYAYWIRKSSLLKTKEKYYGYQDRMGRGMAFHIAPSNVPVNFAVSMTSSLLAGNITCIKISNKNYEQVDVICRSINELLDTDYKYMKNYICIFRYENDIKITQWLSSKCDIRIIWGGNKTINIIRQVQLPPRSIELVFADRYSIAVINSEEYVRKNIDYVKVAKDFYTDTYYSDQNACSSPRMVIWIGKEKEKAKEIFWDNLDKLVEEEYNMKPIQAIDKYNSFCELAMTGEKIELISNNNTIMRVKINRLSYEIMKYKNCGGYFFEYDANELEEILPILKKDCQTISYFGIDKEEIKKMVFEYGVRGVDRIVPLGQTMGLEFVWDGYMMIEAMSRVVY